MRAAPSGRSAVRLLPMGVCDVGGDSAGRIGADDDALSFGMWMISPGPAVTVPASDSTESRPSSTTITSSTSIVSTRTWFGP